MTLGPNMKSIEFYFDYLSPYAYFAWNRLEGFCEDHNLKLEIKPVAFGKLLDHWGQLGPAEIPPKREWLANYCVFYAKQHQLPLAFPKFHPFNSLPALRASLVEVSGELQPVLISEIFRAGWGDGHDIGDPRVLEEIATRLGFNVENLRRQISSEEVKASLKRNTSEAIEKGVFGIPTIIYDGDLYWGSDQFDYLSQCLRNEYVPDRALIKQIIERPRAIDRKRNK